MTSESRARYHWRYAIGWPIAAVVIGGLAIWRCAAALTEGRVDGWTVVVGILGAIVILVVLLAIPVLRSRRRIQNLRNETSGAFVCTVAVYPEAAQQFCDLAEIQRWEHPTHVGEHLGRAVERWPRTPSVWRNAVRFGRRRTDTCANPLGWRLECGRRAGAARSLHHEHSADHCDRRRQSGARQRASKLVGRSCTPAVLQS